MDFNKSFIKKISEIYSKPACLFKHTGLLYPSDAQVAHRALGHDLRASLIQGIIDFLHFALRFLSTIFLILSSYNLPLYQSLEVRF